MVGIGTRVVYVGVLSGIRTTTKTRRRPRICSVPAYRTDQLEMVRKQSRTDAAGLSSKTRIPNHQRAQDRFQIPNRTLLIISISGTVLCGGESSLSRTASSDRRPNSGYSRSRTHSSNDRSISARSKANYW